MRCVYCGAKTEVTNSRSQRRSNQKWRRRQCLGCKAVFTSHEAIDLSGAIRVGNKPFLIDMLFTELLLALQDLPNCYLAAREVTSTVIKELLESDHLPQLTASEISRTAAKVLKRFDRRAWLRYVAEHQSLQG